MKKNTLLTLIGLLLITVLMMTACGGTAEEPAAPEAPAEETGGEEATEEPAEEPAAPGEKAKVVVFVGLGTGTDPDQIAAQEALAEKFNAEHDDIEMEFMIVPNDESNERLVAMVSGGNPPDLVGPGGVDVAAGYFDLWLDVGPMIEKDNLDLSDFYGAAVEMYNYPEKTVGLPLGVFPSFIFYNKDKFDAVGVDYPTSDYGDTSWDLEALRELAMKLTFDENGNDANSADFDSSAIAQWGFNDSWTDLRGFMTRFDPPGAGRPTSPDMKTAQVNSDEYKFGLDWLNKAIWEDHFIADSAGQQIIDSANDPFGSELVAMFYSHTWFMPEGLVDLPFDYDFAVAPYSQKGTRTARIHADTFYIPKNAPNPEASWEVLKWLTGQENIVETCLIYGCLPARQSVEEDYTARMVERYGDHDYSVIYGSIEYLDNPHHESWMPNVERANDILQAEVYDLVFTEPVDDTDALLEQANEDIQALFDEYWAENQ
jgi:multiple sugar transport system substrate-binding protein